MPLWPFQKGLLLLPMHFTVEQTSEGVDEVVPTHVEDQGQMIERSQVIVVHDAVVSDDGTLLLQISKQIAVGDDVMERGIVRVATTLVQMEFFHGESVA